MIRPVATLSRMAPYALAQLDQAGAVSLAQNESAFPPSPSAIEAARAALADLQLYPDPDWQDLRAAIAGQHGLTPARLLCGAGSMELIACLVRAYLEPGRELVGSDHGYLFVKTTCDQVGADYISAPEVDYRVDVDALLDRVGERTEMVFLCNPGNPTGTRIPNGEILRLRAALPGDVMLVIDQAYGEFDDQDPRPVFDLVERGDSVVLRSFSKAYGLAGARVGWGLLPEPVAGELRKLLNPNNVSSASQAAAVAALRDQDYMTSAVEETAKRRDAVARDLSKAGYAIPESHTNFLLIPFASESAAAAADARLRQAGLLLRGMGGYGLGHCLRATVGSEDAMRKLTRCLIDLKESGDVA
jgi:histidinol-phosphate aminotransferase